MFIRTATIADSPAISVLMGQLGYPMAIDLVEHKLRSQSTTTDTVFVAIRGDHIIGCLSAHAHELFHVAGRLGRIMALVVDADARGMGVGRALVEEATAHFLRLGCILVELTSGDHRAGAHDFYRAIGFEEDKRRFVKRL